MTKKTNNKPKPILTITSLDFKNQLSERIDIGEELFRRQINNRTELENLESEFRFWNDYNFEYLQQIFDAPDNEYADKYNHAGYSFMGPIGIVQGNPVETEKNLIKYKLDNLKSLSAKSTLLKSNVLDTKASEIPVFSKKEIFIVHGHDELARTKTARFIERLGFKPIILHEQSTSGKTIIEKIEEYSNVGFGIVLYTPCDVGAAKTQAEKLNNRARQNVIFEHGYLIGKIGRKNVCALVKGNIELPNDITGVVYVKMDDDDAWNLKIAKELKSSGYEVDMNKL